MNLEKLNTFYINRQVYSGKGPHNENSINHPLNNYGRVKLECEKLAQNVMPM